MQIVARVTDENQEDVGGEWGGEEETNDENHKGGDQFKRSEEFHKDIKEQEEYEQDEEAHGKESLAGNFDDSSAKGSLGEHVYIMAKGTDEADVDVFEHKESNEVGKAIVNEGAEDELERDISERNGKLQGNIHSVNESQRNGETDCALANHFVNVMTRDDEHQTLLSELKEEDVNFVGKSGTSSFSFKCDERAEKRREFYSKLEERLRAKEVEKNQMQAKTQEEMEMEMRHLRKSLTFKASPMPNFYQESPVVKTAVKKTQLTRPKSPKLATARRMSVSGAEMGGNGVQSQRMRLEMLEQIERYRTSSATPAVKEFEHPSPPPGSVNQELPSSSSEETLPTLPTVISEEESLSLPGAQDEESAPPPSTSSAVTETASPSSSAANDVPEQSLPASETLSPTPNTIPKVSDEYTKSLPLQSAAVPAEEQAGGNITVGLIGLVGGVLVGVAVLLNLPTDLAATANSSNAVVDTTPEGEKQQNYSSQAKDSERSTIPENDQV
ncbi:unnamed protein product [Sphagnum troendelagicum]|uniref:TPX2 C-terminal domain-containing protein n=1 Tax=Sphagnum troendelagicum TaxID=128251 RepID=A0ABP0T939_9BRYO